MFTNEIRAKAYAQVLSSGQYGVPLWDPSGSDEVAIGHVGYVKGGRYHKLLVGAVADTPENTYSRDDTRKRAIVSEKHPQTTPLPVLYPHMIANVLPNWENHMLWNFRYSLPREINDGRSTNFCTVEAGVSLVAAPEWGYVNNHKTFARIVCENSREWLDHADKQLPPEVVEDGIIFVTGFLRGNRDWDMYCKIRDHPVFGTSEEFQAGCDCETITKFRHNARCEHPHRNANTFNQPIFLSYSKMKRRPRGTSSITTRQHRHASRFLSHVQHSSKGYVPLSGDEDDGEDEDECDPETLFKHPIDWTLDYIFETSPEADIAFVSDRQIFKICKTCDTQPLIQRTVDDEVRGKRWRTNNFYFYLQYHRPKVVVVDGVATLDTTSGSLFSVLCPIPLYKPLRTIYVYTRVRKSRLPRRIPQQHPPANAFLEIRVVSPTFDKSPRQLEMSQKSSGPVLRFRHV